MSGFNGNTIQTTDGAALAEVVTDRDLPASGALNLDLIKRPWAMAPTVGVDCKLIHGDQWEQVGLPASFSRGNLWIFVHGDTNITFDGSRNTTVQGNDSETIFGSSNYTYVDSQNITNTNTVTVSYANDLQIYHPTETSWWQDTSKQGFGFLFQLIIAQIQIIGFQILLITGVPNPLEGPGLPALSATLIAGFNLTLDLVHLDNSFVINAEGATLAAKWNAITAKLFGARAAAGGASAGAHAAANAVPGPPLARH